MTKTKSKRRNFLARIGAILGSSILAAPLFAKSEKNKAANRLMNFPFLGEIRMFAGNFAPLGYEFCDGQLLLISGNTALFSILGITYGGDGNINFGLPDLRSRFPMHAGSGPSLSNRNLGKKVVWSQLY